jgi:hypothetical protein
MGETSDGLTAARQQHKIISLYDAICYLQTSLPMKMSEAFIQNVNSPQFVL